MFRPLNRQIVKALPRSRILTSRPVHTMQVPFSGPPSYETIARRFSSLPPDPHAFFTRKRQQEALDRDGFIDIHDARPERITPPTKYDVLISDLDHEKLKTEIADEVGIPYLSTAAKADAERRVRVVDGYIYGPNDRTIIPMVVTHKEEARWVFFILDSGCPWVYLSAETSKALGIVEDTGAWVMIGGRKDVADIVPSKSHFTGINLLGTSFLRIHEANVWLDYKNRRAKLFFDGEWNMVEKPNS